ncbi:MAG: hypothetical protein E2O90_12710 [Alphaproteobacteria bacterium]|nr:hypothetical protein [Pseudomonadota bacterium]TDI63241.1 MAG: hypothetical protein E2O90_12710 [Alphaproteobacteria bacterium]
MDILMATRAKSPKDAKTGRFSVHSKGKKASGALVWEIRDNKHSTQKVVITSPSSAAAIRTIGKIHSKALKRLAKK